MELSVLQWNCMYNEDFNKIISFIADLNPDVVCLQELTENHQNQGDTAKRLAEYTGYDSHYAYGLMVFPDGSQGRMGNGIFSRFPLSGKKTVYLDQQRTDDAGKLVALDRFYLQAEVQLPNGRKPVIGTTHLPFHPRMVTSPYKRAMVEKLLTTLPQDKACIVTGDLNTTPSSGAARMMRQAGLRNAGPALTQPTWTTKPFAIGPWSYERLQWRFDYVLYRGNLRSVAAHTVSTELSDHLPILSKMHVA